MNQQKIAEIFARFQAANPQPRTELVYSNPFELLIAVILSAQSTDVGVNKATAQLFLVANTPAAMLKLGLSALAQHIKSIGLYPTKSKNIYKTCEILCDQFDGIVPSTREALESLPGVGRKTANVLLNTLFGEPTIAVDTHIFRVANRTGLARGKSPLIVEKKLMQVVPTQYLLHAHHWLVLHGRYVCVARKPKCYDCLIADLCELKNKTVL